MKRAGLLFVTVLIVAVTFPNALVTPAEAQSWSRASSVAKSLENNRVLAQRFHLDMIAMGHLDIAEQIIAPDCVIHMRSTTFSTPGKGPEKAREIAQGDLDAFPGGIELIHDGVLAEGNLVAFYWTLNGTTATGEVSRLAGIDVVRVEDEKIAEMWIEYHTIEEEQ